MVVMKGQDGVAGQNGSRVCYFHHRSIDTVIQVAFFLSHKIVVTCRRKDRVVGLFCHLSLFL